MNFPKIMLLSGLALPVYPQLSRPHVGMAHYPDGTLHPVDGLPANFLVSNRPTTESVLAAAFSDQGGLIYQDASIRLVTPSLITLSTYPASEKPVFSIANDISTALAWLPSSHTLIHVNSGKLEGLSVASIATETKVCDLEFVSASEARLVVEEPGREIVLLTVSLRNGELINSQVLPGVQGPAFVQNHLFVYWADHEIIADDLAGHRRSLPFPALENVNALGDITTESMSSNWRHLFSASLQEHWAVNLTPSIFRVSILPAAPRHAKAVLANNARREAR